jgi:anti-sigma factor RsiW
MNCQRVRAQAYDYFERKLGAAERSEIDAHVAGCATCGELWAKARETCCREVADFLGEYVDGSLAAERRRIFERHLSICPACVDYLATYRASIEAARTACRPLAAVIEAMPDRLIQAILAARRREG